VVVAVAPAPQPSAADTATSSLYGGGTYGSSTSSARFTPSSAPAQPVQQVSSGFFPFGQSMKREREW
jgi:hypothetical protein